MIIIGLVILVAAVAIGVAGVVNNTGTEHALQDDFTIFGVHVTGSTGTLFLVGLVVGAAGMLGLALLLAGARRYSRRERYARHELERRDAATAVPGRDTAAVTTPPADARQTAHPRSLRHPFGGDTGQGTPHPSH
ncbi:hypothetical protein [Rhodococcus sp. SGAir0479]|uniref:hypothetical protein n=1 Tax=Rhodococcus sp. SGAir0479 TaxID=2567884 RepID=UPI0010CCFE5F|nr:hypothetical protein [Rhodococcus sp. SGAir0479]QCQ91371.1 hypothetical protein E7742_09055 [Rhodococcus sp. SGAir0479]